MRIQRMSDACVLCSCVVGYSYCEAVGYSYRFETKVYEITTGSGARALEGLWVHRASHVQDRADPLSTIGLNLDQH